MPLRRVVGATGAARGPWGSRDPDLERLAGILDASRGESDAPRVGWVPPRPIPAVGRHGPDGDGAEGTDGAERTDGAEGADAAESTAEPNGREHRDAQGHPDAAEGAVDAIERLDLDLRRARRPGVVTIPEQLRSGRRSVSSAAVLALLALVVALACVFVLRILWAERQAGGTPPPANTPRPTLGVTSTARPSSSTGNAPAAEVVVHVVGQVARPGLVRLRAGSRVADAITAAGGARPGADLGALNLARVVADGEQVVVPRPGERLPPASTGGGPDGAAGGQGGVGSAKVNLNTADVAALNTLPGVGPVLAQRIVDWRTEHGRFSSVDELGEVSGIGDKLLAQLRTRVSV